MKLKDLLNEATDTWIVNFAKANGWEDERPDDIQHEYDKALRDEVWKKYKSKKIAGWSLDIDMHSGGWLLINDEWYDNGVQYIGVTPFWEGSKGVDGEAYVEFGGGSDFVYHSERPKWTGDVKKDAILWEKAAKRIVQLITGKLKKIRANTNKIEKR